MIGKGHVSGLGRAKVGPWHLGLGLGLGRAKVRSGTGLDIHMFSASHVLGRWERGEHQNIVSVHSWGLQYLRKGFRTYVSLPEGIDMAFEVFRQGSTWRLRYLGIDIYLESETSFGFFSST